jgi:uncharacterized protein YkwD
MCHSIISIARRAALTILGVMLLACGDGRAATAPDTRSRGSVRTAGPTDRAVISFVKLMNAHRASRGLSPLVWDSRVASVAQAHSRDMFERHYFSHTSFDGRSTWDRLAVRGVTYSRAGENIALGQVTGRAVLEAWLRSPGHRKNIERGSYTHHGVGKVGTYWTHVFIRREKATPLRARKRPLRGDDFSHE